MLDKHFHPANNKEKMKTVLRVYDHIRGSLVCLPFLHLSLVLIWLQINNIQTLIIRWLADIHFTDSERKHFYEGDVDGLRIVPCGVPTFIL